MTKETEWGVSLGFEEKKWEEGELMKENKKESRNKNPKTESKKCKGNPKAKKIDIE